MLLWIVDLKLLEIGVAIEKLLMIGDAVIIDPIVRTNKAIRKPAHVSLPVADEKIKIVRSVTRGSRRFTCYYRRQRELQDVQPVICTQFHGFKQRAIIALPTLPTRQLMRLGLTRRLAFFLPRHHAGPSRFVYLHDRQNPLLSSTQRVPRWPHLASRAFVETHSR